jgi:hypothetical protein
MILIFLAIAITLRNVMQPLSLRRRLVVLQILFDRLDNWI